VALEVTDLSQLDQAAVDARRSLVIALLAEGYPQSDWRRGAFGDLVAEPAAATMTASAVESDRLRRASTLAGIEADPALADPALVDAALSNYGVTRRAASFATGLVTIVLDAAVPAVVPAVSRFSANGIDFLSSASVAARPSADLVVASTDSVLRPLADGTYAFDVPVMATTAGVAGSLRAGAPVEIQFSLAHFVSCRAAGDFLGGSEAETNAQLMARLRAGLAARTWSSRPAIEGLARTIVPGLLATSVLGSGDPEFGRCRRGLLPAAKPGYADLLARTASLPTSAIIQADATLISKTTAAGTWQVMLPRSAAAGMYEVVSATRVDTGRELDLVYDLRSADLVGLTGSPDVELAVDVAFSAAQAITVRFEDTAVASDSTLSVGAIKTLNLLCRSMPGIADLQAGMAAASVRAPGVNLLVRAPIPCDVSAGIDLDRAPTGAAPDVAAVVAAVCARANATRFPGVLRAADLAAAAQNASPAGTSVARVELLGRLLRTDATREMLVGRPDLRIPDEFAWNVGPRTVAFFLDPADVAVSVLGGPAED